MKGGKTNNVQKEDRFDRTATNSGIETRRSEPIARASEPIKFGTYQEGHISSTVGNQKRFRFSQ